MNNIDYLENQTPHLCGLCSFTLMQVILFIRENHLQSLNMILLSCIGFICGSSVPLCAILGFIFGYVWLHHLEAPSEHITRHYAVGVWAVGVSCVLEVCCEPLYLTAQVYLFIKLRVRIRQSSFHGSFGVLRSLYVTLGHTNWTIVEL